MALLIPAEAPVLRVLQLPEACRSPLAEADVVVVQHPKRKRKTIPQNYDGRRFFSTPNFLWVFLVQMFGITEKLVRAILRPSELLSLFLGTQVYQQAKSLLSGYVILRCLLFRPRLNYTLTILSKKSLIRLSRFE